MTEPISDEALAHERTRPCAVHPRDWFVTTLPEKTYAGILARLTAAETERDRLRKVLEETRWRRVDTAPITGSGDYAVNMLLTDGDYLFVGYRIEPDAEYDPRGEEEFIHQKGGWITPRPTHWMPLPEPRAALSPEPRGGAR